MKNYGRRRKGKKPSAQGEALGSLESTLELVQFAREQAAGAKGRIAMAEREASRARSYTVESLQGSRHFEPNRGGVSGLLGALHMAEDSMQSVLSHTTVVKEHGQAAYAAVASLESTLLELQKSLQALAVPSDVA